MAELSLTAILGPGASQTSTTVTIAKADLVGLIASASNTGDSLAVAILNLLATAYPVTARAADKDISLIATLSPIPAIEGDFTVSPNIPYIVSTYQIKAYKLFPATAPVPNDY